MHSSQNTADGGHNTDCAHLDLLLINAKPAEQYHMDFVAISLLQSFNFAEVLLEGNTEQLTL